MTLVQSSRPSSRRARWRWWGPLFVAFLLLIAGTREGVELYLNRDAVRPLWRGSIERRLSAGEGSVRLAEALSLSWRGCARIGPLQLLTQQPESPAWLEVRTLQACPRWLPLLWGEVSLSEVTLEQVRLRPGPDLKDLRAWLDKRRAFSAASGAASASARSSKNIPRLHIRDLKLWLALDESERPLEIGPLQAEAALRQVNEGLSIAAEATLSGGSNAQGEVLLPEGKTESGALRLELSLPRAERLSSTLLRTSPVRPVSGAASLTVSAHWEAGGREGEATVEGALKVLHLKGEHLAPEPVGPLQLESRATVRWDRARKRATVSEGKVCVGEGDALCLQVEGEVLWAGIPWGRASVRADSVVYSQALKAVPAALRPDSAQLPTLNGAMNARFEVKGPLRSPAEWELVAALDLSELRRASRSTPFFLRQPFSYQPLEASRPREIWVGARNPDFVPLEELPPTLLKAVTVSEDAGFYGHSGFDFQEMKDSWVSAVEAKRFRGASTLTQQLAKNLFLTREKTYARKVREAWLTLALEAALPKARLLEIYLNIIEWGPGIYGIGEAAHHYFGVDARSLTVKQVAFLVSIIPNPVRYHGYFTRGALSEVWEQRVEELLVKLRNVGALSEQDFALASATPVVFRSASDSP